MTTRNGGSAGERRGAARRMPGTGALSRWTLRAGWALSLALLLGAVAGCARSGSEGTGASVDRTTAAPRAGRVDVAEAKQMLAEHADALVLDVRNPDEWNDDVGHIEGARLIPLPELTHRMTEIAEWRDKPVIVVCRVGVRSEQAADMLASSGFHRVYNLAGGMEAWRRAGS